MLKSMIHSLSGLAARLRPASRHECELAYLNGAANLYDLEQRQIQIERGLFGGCPASLHLA
ncbi:MAG: hypothetical protein ORN49_12280 [Rhodobacteraceae bacterium]|nr:hypothetical protein [Paracoccaceae bacterium]